MSMYDRGIMSLGSVLTGVCFGYWQQNYWAGLWMASVGLFISIVIASQHEEEE